MAEESVEILRGQRDLLGEMLGKVLVHVGMIRKDAPMTGPELLVAAKTFLESPREN